MGSLRFILAICVLLFHAGMRPFGLLFGASAVIVFYIISGYVMTLLVTRYYNEPERFGLFYLDRATRLFPQYIFYLVATVALTKVALIDSTFLTGCNATFYIMNLAVIPLNFAQMSELWHCMFVPQAWSLGLEMCFYLVVPFLLLFHRAIPWIALASFLVYLLAYADIIDNDIYGYRLLPGTLFVFLSGAALANQKLFWRYQLLFFWGASVMLLAAAFAVPSLALLNREVLIGFAVGLPLVITLKDRDFPPIDTWLGNLSYGIFLNHFFLLFVFNSVFGVASFGPGVAVGLIAASISLASASYLLVEKPSLALRRRFRQTSEPSLRTSAVTAQRI